MTARVRTGLLVAAVVGGLAFLIWRLSSPPAEREIRARLTAFVEDFNASTTDGLGTVARAARLGQFFTPDVVVEFGQGSPPIHGRETLMGMAARLQPRTAAFVLELDDVTVELLDESRADVTMTALIRRRSFHSGDESIDAREFSAEFRHTDGQWRVSRVVAIDTLR
jgi:hypothetical protein